MANIGSRTFNLVDDQYLSLANEEWVRTLAIGSNWTKLRLGVLLSVTPDDVNNLNGVQLVFGLCAGKTNPYGAASTTNFLGMKFGGTTGGDLWTYKANSGNPYFGTERIFIKKTAATVIGLSSAAGEVHRVNTNNGTLQRRGVQFLDIAKGTPNFTVTQWAITLGSMAKDFSAAHLLDGLEQSGSISVNGETMNSMPLAIPFDETAGALDTVDVFWNKSAFPLEVHAIAAYRLA
ncbi:hypothetical protein GC207_12860 [bacterium]|nr:hypothetical protein [bacterium]